MLNDPPRDDPPDRPVTKPGVPLIEYGVGRRRLGQRWIAVSIVALSLSLAYWLVRPRLQPSLDQVAHLRQQRKVASHVLAPDTVIYTEALDRVAALRSRTDYRDKRYNPWGISYPSGLPDAWERVYASETLEGSDGSSVSKYQIDDTFGYRRTSAGGVDWIVHLGQVNPWPTEGGGRRVGLTQGAIRPVGWAPGTRGLAVSFMSKQVLLGPTDVFTLFAPQPDPADASAVRVPYELNGQRGELRAVVTDRGYVDFSNASGPATVEK